MLGMILKIAVCLMVLILIIGIVTAILRLAFRILIFIPALILGVALAIPVLIIQGIYLCFKLLLLPRLPYLSFDTLFDSIFGSSDSSKGFDWGYQGKTESEKLYELNEHIRIQNMNAERNKR